MLFTDLQCGMITVSYVHKHFSPIKLHLAPILQSNSVSYSSELPSSLKYYFFKLKTR